MWPRTLAGGARGGNNCGRTLEPEVSTRHRPQSKPTTKARSEADMARPLWQPGAVLRSLFGRLLARDASGSRGTRVNRGPELDKSAANARGSTWLGSGLGLGFG